MSYKGIDHIFLYHAYALAAGGWVKQRGTGSYTELESVAPAVLSISGGHASASVYKANSTAKNRFPFGDGGPAEFHVYVGHAYTECRGREEDDVDNAMGIYKTTVRSVLDDFRINDIVTVEHAEAILVSMHEKPDGRGNKPEAKVYVGASNLSGLRVNGRPYRLTKNESIDTQPTFEGLESSISGYVSAVSQRRTTADMQAAAKNNPFAAEFCKANDVFGIEGQSKDAPPYLRDLARIAAATKGRRRYSVFSSIDGPGAHGTSIDVPDFGRIFLGEVICSHGMKQLNMLRFDLGCDNCGGYTGGGGTTNGETMP